MLAAERRLALQGVVTQTLLEARILAHCAKDQAGGTGGIIQLEDAWLQYGGSDENGQPIYVLIIVMEMASSSLIEVDFGSS